MSDYYTIPTTLGSARLAAAANIGQSLTLSHMGFGDANGVPYLPNSRVNATALVNERYRIAAQYVIQDTENPNVYIIKARIPANIGGFEICELGIFDTNGELIYLANYPRTFKPQITQGAGGELTIKLHVMTSHSSSISIILDPHVITLTQGEGDNRYALKTELATESQNRLNEDVRIESDRVNNDLALSISLAAEITNRENADNTKANLGGSSLQRFKVANAINLDEAVSLEQLYNQKSGYFNTPILTLTNGQTGSITLPPRTIVRILLVGGGAGGGQVNENYSGVNDYSSYPNQGVAENGTTSNISIVGIGEIARADGGLGGKSGMRDLGEDAGRYTGYAGNHGHASLNVGYAMLLGAARQSDLSPKRVYQDHPYPYYAYTISSVPLGNYGLGGNGAYGSFSTNDPSGAAGAGGNGAILECLIKNSTDSNMTLNLSSGEAGEGYYYDIDGNNYAGSNGQGGLIVVYA